MRRDTMSKKQSEKKFVIIILVIVVIILLFIVIQFIDFFPGNSEIATGNTAGNLYNGGYFCEYNGKVYFSYPADEYRIYIMSGDGSVQKTNLKDASSINITNDYLYYAKNSARDGERKFLEGLPFGIHRYSLKFKSSKALSSVLAPYLCLSGNYLYLQEYTDTGYYFAKVSVNDKADYTRISDVAYPISCAENGYLYYAEIQEDHNIYKYDTRNGNTELFYEGNCFQPIYAYGYLYFIDLNDNYALKRVDMETNDITVITSDRCINYNVYNDVIYYEIENPETNRYGLFRNNMYGTNEEQITDSPCNNINITADYTYFQYYKDKQNFYRTSTTGPISVELFTLPE